MKRISGFAAMAVLVCGVPLAQARAGHAAHPCDPCDPCAKPGLFQRWFARDCCEPVKCEPRCKKVKPCKPKCEPCCKKVKPCKPECDPCDPCCNRNLFDRIRDRFHRCDCPEKCHEVKCDPCDPCARRFRFPFRKRCCDGDVIVEHGHSAPAPKAEKK